jgi:hypothetical protein
MHLDERFQNCGTKEVAKVTIKPHFPENWCLWSLRLCAIDTEEACTYDRHKGITY